MGHISGGKEDIYRLLAERLNKNPIGAPVNEVLIEILYRLYSEKEARLGSKMPLIPVTLDSISAITETDGSSLEETLNNMVAKGLVLELPRKDGIYYFMTPMIIGFFEYLFMRVRDDLPMKELAELFNQYFQNIEVGRELFGSETKLSRAMAYESIIPAAVESEVLDYERASEVIRKSGGGAVSLCACRHKAQHLNKPCELDAPLDVCISLGHMAELAIKSYNARPASVDELLKVLEQTEKIGLVHVCDNVLNEPVFICNCCGCCCGFLNTARDYGIRTLHPSNFMASVDTANCSGCGICVERCQVRAVKMVDSENGGEVARVKARRCIGCGICASACAENAMTVVRRPEIRQPVGDRTELFIRLAEERGKDLAIKPGDRFY